MKIKLQKLLALILVLMLMNTTIGTIASAAATLKLPAKLEIIQEQAFYGDKSLQKVVIPDGTTQIRSRAFANSSLTELVLPDTLTYIANDAFSGCGQFTVRAPEDCYAYDWCIENGLQVTSPYSPASDFKYTVYSSYVEITDYIGPGGDVSIPSKIEGKPVQSIAVMAFYSCKKITSTTIPDSVTSIGRRAFEDCWYLESITIPEGITKIDDGTFESCWKLKRIAIPEGVVSIGKNAFEFCNDLESVSIPSSVKTIEADAFLGCDSLTNVKVPYGVTEIGSSAFFSCENLESINLPASLTSIGASAFAYCPNLTAMVAKGSYAHGYCSDNNINYTFMSSTPTPKPTTTPAPTSAISITASYSNGYLSWTVTNSAALYTIYLDGVKLVNFSESSYSYPIVLDPSVDHTVKVVDMLGYSATCIIPGIPGATMPPALTPSPNPTATPAPTAAQMYSISDLKVENTEIVACVSSDKACEILIQILSDGDRNELFSFTGQISEGLDSEEVSITIPSNFILPRYFVLRAVLRNNNGKELCNPYTTLHYTSAYDEFNNTTADDYSGKPVLDYGEHGFAVATEDAIKVSSVATTSDNNSYTFRASQKPSVGDVLLLSTDGSFYEPIKVGSVKANGSGNYTITRDKNATLADLYDKIKIDTQLDAGAAAYGARDTSGSTGLHWNFTAGPLSVDVDGRATVSIRTLYDKDLFGEDYVESEFCVDLSLIAEGSATGKFNNASLNPMNPNLEWVLYDGPIAIYGPGAPLAVELAVTVPVEFELEAGGTFVLEISNRSGFRHTPDNGVQSFKTSDSDCRIELGGGFMVQAGPKVKLSAIILHGILEGSISGQVGLRAEGEAVHVVHDLNLGEKDHACDLCCDIDPSFFADITASLEAGISEKYRVQLLGFDILKTNQSLGKAYLSIINEKESQFGGKMHFDWGTCPNYKYRTMIYTQDMNGNEVSGIPISVTSGGKASGSGSSPFRVYLYNGTYNAEAKFASGTYGTDFTVFRKAQSVVISDQYAELSGTVLDANTRKAISGARVQVTLSKDITFTTMTNAYGYYKLNFDPVNSFDLLITASGYKDWKTTIERNNRSKISVDAQMLPLTYTVTFNPGKGSGTMSPLVVRVGESFELPDCSFTPPENMSFDSWTIGGKSYAPGSSYTSPGGDVVVYASWKENALPDGMVSYNGNYYKIFEGTYTWHEAKAMCEALGGHLVTITDANEQTFIEEYVTERGYPYPDLEDSRSNFWMGFYQDIGYPTYKWITGEPFRYYEPFSFYFIWADGNDEPGVMAFEFWDAVGWNWRLWHLTYQCNFICEWEAEDAPW